METTTPAEQIFPLLSFLNSKFKNPKTREHIILSSTLTHIHSTFFPLLSSLLKSISSNSSSSLSSYQILITTIISLHPPPSLIRSLLYTYDPSTESGPRQPTPTEISSLLSVFKTYLDQTDRFYFLSSLMTPQSEYISYLSDFVQFALPSEASLTLIFHLTLFYINFRVSKTKKNEKFSSFIGQLEAHLETMFKGFVSKLTGEEEMDSHHSLMLYFEYLLMIWLLKFPTEFIPKIKKIVKKHPDFKVNRLFMIALYIPAGMLSMNEI
jgi:hypothetical protein